MFNVLDAVIFIGAKQYHVQKIMTLGPKKLANLFSKFLIGNWGATRIKNCLRATRNKFCRKSSQSEIHTLTTNANNMRKRVQIMTLKWTDKLWAIVKTEGKEEGMA